jgi:hypothetical protein
MTAWIVVARITACDVSKAANAMALWHYTTYSFGYEGDPNDSCTEVLFYFGRKIACSSIDSQCDDTLFFFRSEMVYIPSITVDV